MIRAYVVGGDPHDETDFGLHFFEAVPRVGESAVVFLNGDPTPVVIETVFHHAKPVSIPSTEDEPYLKLHVRIDPAPYERIAELFTRTLSGDD